MRAGKVPKVRAVTGASSYRGIAWCKRNQTWQAKLTLGGHTEKFCGRFHDEAEAGRAYDRVLLSRYGRQVTAGSIVGHCVACGSRLRAWPGPLPAAAAGSHTTG